MILVNGSKGIAVGYAANILQRDYKDVIKQCLNYLNNKPLKTIKPKMNFFNGKFIKDKTNDKKWLAVGKIEKINTSTIKITELSPSMTYEKFENILESLVTNKQIVSYDDNSKDSIDYIIKFNRQILNKLNEEDLIKMFKLSENYTEDFNTLDEYGKLKIFESVEEIIKYFVDFRLTFYQKRKDYLINKLNNDLFILSNRVKFIKAIIDNKLKVTKRKRSVIEKDLVKMKIQRYQDSYNYLLNMNINSLTYEKYTELLEFIKTKTKELNKIKKYIPTQMYIKDLNELK
jgi:DNA topoisomerase-2